MQLKLFGKTFLALLSFVLLSLAALSIVVFVYGRRYQDHVAAMNAEVVAYAEAETAHIYRDAERVHVCATANDIAQAAEEQLEKRDETLAALSSDQSFASATAQVVYTHGATGVVEPKARLIITHPRADMVGKNLDMLPEFRGEYAAPLWKLFDDAITLDEVSGTYKKAEDNGVIKEHIVCLVRIPMLTTDNVRLLAFANAYRDDIGMAKDMLSGSLRQKYGEASAEATATFNEMEYFLIFAFVVLLLAAFGITWIFSRSVARPINGLANVCEHIAFGRFDTPIPKYSNKDEVAELAASIARMQKNLTAQAEVIKQQTVQQEAQANDLREALRIAEERTKALLSLAQKQK
jgi:HAMP domain-containing protein